MKQKLLLIRAGGFGRVVLEHANALYNCAFLDDGDASIVNGVPVIGWGFRKNGTSVSVQRNAHFV